MTVDKERMELWASALEANGDKQCTDVLTEVDDNGVRLHCALGVGMAVAELNGVCISERDWERSSFPDSVVTWYGLYERDPKLDPPDGIPVANNFTVMWANDHYELTFFAIAQMLRAKYIKDES